MSIEQAIRDGVTFKTIPGFSRYRVGDNGSVWTSSRRVWREMKYKRKVIYGKVYDYQEVFLQGDDKKTWYTMVHAAVLTAFVGPRPKGMQCCHNDGNAANNRLENLRWDTPKNNTADTIKMGKHYSKNQPSGGQSHKAKLCDEEAEAVRWLYQSGKHSQQKIAVFLGVTLCSIQKILNGVSFKKKENKK